MVEMETKHLFIMVCVFAWCGSTETEQIEIIGTVPPGVNLISVESEEEPSTTEDNLKPTVTPNIAGTSSSGIHSTTENNPLTSASTALSEGSKNHHTSNKATKTETTPGDKVKRQVRNTTVSVSNEISNEGNPSKNKTYEETSTTPKKSTSTPKTQGRQAIDSAKGTESNPVSVTRCQEAESNPEPKTEKINVKTDWPTTKTVNLSSTAGNISSTTPSKPGNSTVTGKPKHTVSVPTTTPAKNKSNKWKKVLDIIGKTIAVFTLVGGAFYMIYSVHG